RALRCLKTSAAASSPRLIMRMALRCSPSSITSVIAFYPVTQDRGHRQGILLRQFARSLQVFLIPRLPACLGLGFASCALFILFFQFVQSRLGRDARCLKMTAQ